MLLFILMLKAIVEVALFAFVGQGILYIMAGDRRESNLVFTMLKMVTAPMTYFVRAISPRVILDRHIPLATFIFLCTIWLALTILKVQIMVRAT